MKYNITRLVCRRVSYMDSWVVEMEATYSIGLNYPWEKRYWSSERCYLSKSLIKSIFKMWWKVRSEIKEIQEQVNQDMVFR